MLGDGSNERRFGLPVLHFGDDDDDPGQQPIRMHVQRWDNGPDDSISSPAYSECGAT